MPQSAKPRGDKRQRTRQALIAATLDVIDETGFAGASLEAIARRAGVTRGSIYSNFADRDELMMAAVASRGMTLDRDFSQPAPLEAQLRRFADNLLAQFPAAAGGGGLVIEFQIYAMSQPRLRAQLAAGYEAMFGADRVPACGAVRGPVGDRPPRPRPRHPGPGHGAGVAIPADAGDGEPR